MMRFDKNGVELADVPNAGVGRRDPNAKSGNPVHDVRSGKFGASGPPQDDTPAPPNVDPIAHARMMDAVREAARNFDAFDEGDAQEFLAARAKDPNAVDIQAFIELVRQQTITDMVDILDQQMRSLGSKPFGKRKVKLSAPRGYVRKTINDMEPDDVAALMHRLEARGHDREDVDAFFTKKGKATPEIRGKRDAVTLADMILSVPSPELPAQERAELILNLSRVLTEKTEAPPPPPQPVVHVHPNIHIEAPKETAKEVVRDERGLIAGVRSVGGD